MMSQKTEFRCHYQEADMKSLDHWKDRKKEEGRAKEGSREEDKIDEWKDRPVHWLLLPLRPLPLASFPPPASSSSSSSFAFLSTLTTFFSLKLLLSQLSSCM